MEKQANRLGFTGYELYQALNPVSKRESIFGFAFNTPIGNLEKPISPVNVISREKSKKANNKGIYLKNLLITLTPSQAKEKFLELYPDRKEFGVKRFKIYMNDIKMGRY